MGKELSEMTLEAQRYRTFGKKRRISLNKGYTKDVLAERGYHNEK